MRVGAELQSLGGPIGSGLLVWGFGSVLGLGFALVGSEIGRDRPAESIRKSIEPSWNKIWVDSIMVDGATWRDAMNKIISFPVYIV
jgi:hypothetical protein